MWNVYASIRELFTELAAHNGDQWFFVRSANRKDQLHSGLIDAIGQLPEFDSTKANLYYQTELKEIAVREHWNEHCALVTTEGFENLHEIGTQTRENLWSNIPKRKPTIIPNDLIFGITERVSPDGKTEQSINSEDLDAISAKLELAKVTHLGICFLYSTKNSENEKIAAKYFLDKGFKVFCSYDYNGNEQFRLNQLASQVVYQTHKETFLTALESKKFTSMSEVESKDIESYKGKFSHLIYASEKEFYIKSIDSGAKTEFPFQLLNQIKYDPVKRLFISKKKVALDPGPICFGRGLDLSVLDVLVCNKLFTGSSQIKLKVDSVKPQRTLDSMSKAIKDTPSHVAEDLIRLFVNSIASTIKANSINIKKLAYSGTFGGLISNILEKYLKNTETILQPQSQWDSVRSLIPNPPNSGVLIGEFDFSQSKGSS